MPRRGENRYQIISERTPLILPGINLGRKTWFREANRRSTHSCFVQESSESKAALKEACKTRAGAHRPLLGSHKAPDGHLPRDPILPAAIICEKCDARVVRCLHV